MTKELNGLIQERIRLEKELNVVANSANEKARTANQNRIFGGRTNSKGDKISPKQAFRYQEQKVEGLNRRIQS